MSQEENADLALEIASKRYRQGQCPNCGKGLGEPRGLQSRGRTGDLYCHTCKRSWPLQMDAADLRKEFAFRGSSESAGSPPGCNEDPPESDAGSGRRFENLIRKIIRR